MYSFRHSSSFLARYSPSWAHVNLEHRVRQCTVQYEVDYPLDEVQNDGLKLRFYNAVKRDAEERYDVGGCPPVEADMNLSCVGLIGR